MTPENSYEMKDFPLPWRFNLVSPTASGTVNFLVSMAYMALFWPKHYRLCCFNCCLDLAS